ncbi:hypothetical protein GY631_6759 [Trichophyton interdigitale]|nr:hypothetical protein GY631_6759 [Trichophyton interdigitale]
MDLRWAVLSQKSSTAPPHTHSPFRSPSASLPLKPRPSSSSPSPIIVFIITVAIVVIVVVVVVVVVAVVVVVVVVTVVAWAEVDLLRPPTATSPEAPSQTSHSTCLTFTSSTFFRNFTQTFQQRFSFHASAPRTAQLLQPLHAPSSTPSPCQHKDRRRLARGCSSLSCLPGLD